MQHTIVGCLVHLGLEGLGVGGGKTISRSSMPKEKNMAVFTQVIISECVTLSKLMHFVVCKLYHIKMIEKKKQSQWER